MPVLQPVRETPLYPVDMTSINPRSASVSSRPMAQPRGTAASTHGFPRQQASAASSTTEDMMRHTRSLMPSSGCDLSLSESPHPTAAADVACQAAARPGTSVTLLEQMVALRRAGRSLRQIGRHTGRCMESVRQALMRYEHARLASVPSATDEDEWNEPLRDAEPLPPGHPIALRGLWRGLEHWQTDEPPPTNARPASGHQTAMHHRKTHHTDACPSNESLTPTGRTVSRCSNPMLRNTRAHNSTFPAKARA
ncbi:hypothetical protein [Acetobacter senegalensis]|uniref:hypothetical protein n=1 Tax=Acetobacter senegalensis TaxID=446692 RepID=UPI001EDDC0BF|nr:hypothetical protein [Acetobacter senegalensis]MCG4274648.1 hypothetical protein [Acetobacter senegalensis]